MKHLERLHVANCPWSSVSHYKKVRSRIIEISKVSVASLTYPKMLEFLNNANTHVLVIPPHKDGSPRRGCEDPHCPAVRGEVTPIIPTDRVPHSGTFPPRYVVVVLRRSYVCAGACERILIFVDY
ncbi:Signal-induced proliferation-associated 1-like protein 2 [Trichinella patagoniensis]|uniref:Signal-induced proliferation-associated 1-like protein 2 n=1 Tax=Trichinella patagoniensis TaxID=990121 RepID=A0A0V0ZX27_9BILA|nr:Signal-induced proliferation-associated 1-like protein 2 [Trichinella patagoniensis]